MSDPPPPPPSGSELHEKLFTASRAGDGTLVGELLVAGADPNKYKDMFGNAALLEAAFIGKDSIVSMLINLGADLNMQNIHGDTALHRAAVRGKNEVIKTLINLI